MSVQSVWQFLRRNFGPTFHFWMETETHVYAFSIAANVLLSFFPFLIVMMSLCKHVLAWKAAVDAIHFALSESFPGQWSSWLSGNLNWIVMKRGPFEITSVLVLFFTANGVFEPLEVALNRVWKVKVNRSFLRNQMISLGLIFACGTLMLLSLSLTAANRTFLAKAFAQDWSLTGALGSLFFRGAAAMVTMLVLFLIYWLLPNTKIAWRRVLPVAILCGMLIELLKWLTIFFWKKIDEKFYLEYGPFEYAAIMVFWSFLASMLVLGGAEFAARKGIEMKAEEVAAEESISAS
ncbi:MAG: YihY/virulence factor BrkB family protein [Acidobacteria bacterium]|nr:YihY/virulence factor BrkB family protein [Acidobacteriota bacterium]